MTWQRIDDDTYIDDTLVTCAEYQLFIDEMREQGKYYQPDHWISYQFPQGQATEPVLGVRQSDAEAFCDWLAKVAENEWQFRLPSARETNSHLIKSHEGNLIGYWTSSYSFNWIGPAPENPRSLDRQLILDHIGNRDLNLDMHFENNLSTILSRSINRVPEIRFSKIFNFDLSAALNHDPEISNSLTRAVLLKSAINDEFAYPIARALNRSLNIDQRKLDEAVAIIFPYIQKGFHYFEFFIDLFTLQERIAGRSPAFEGIRLVKERIK